MNLKIKSALGFILPLALGAFLFIIPNVHKDFTHIPGDLGDARFNNFILEHVHQFFSGNRESLWDGGFMFPEQDVITYSDNLLGTAPFYSIFRAIGFDRETAFQWWFIVISILNYITAFIFLKYITKNTLAAGLGAFVFAFSLALFSQIGHAQTFPRFAIPLVFYFTARFIESFKPQHFFLLGFFVVYEIYCGIYLGLLTIIPAGIFLITGTLLNKKSFIELKNKMRWCSYLALSTIINILLLLPLMLPYMERASKVMRPTFNEVVDSVPVIQSYIFSIPGSYFWDKLTQIGKFIPAWWDHTLFPGAITILSIIIVCIGFISLKKWRSELLNSNIQVAIFFAFTICFFIFLRQQHFTLYWLVYHLPGFYSIRSVTRYINIELLFFGWSVSMAFVLLIKKYSKIQIPVFIILISLLAIDNYMPADAIYNFEKVDSQHRVNQIVKAARFASPQKKSILAYCPKDPQNNPVAHQLDAMLAAQTLNLKTINGYTATSPAEFTPFWNKPSIETLYNWIKSTKTDTLKNPPLIVP